ncbi:MAG: S8 family serine peptidase, partial [Planctomycetes bacterium]|nr:S8 family serine peptidase [Planctomycetota bacterium]
MADNDTDDIVLARNDDDEDGQIDEDPPNNGNKIVVLSAGNEGDAPNYAYDLVYGLSSPEVFDVPERGTRTRNTYPSQSSLFMAVSSSGVVDPPTGPERAWEFSSIGSRVSVSAAGSQEVVAVQTNTQFRTSGGGTSWAAPQVAGLAGELLFLLDNVAGMDPMSPLQVVQLIEATADDLGTTGAAPPFANDAPGNADDDRFGYGRINCWKAILSAVNGGLAEETAYARAKSYGAVVFESLRDNWINEADTKWYGFK